MYVLLKTGKPTTLSIFCERAQKALIWQSGQDCASLVAQMVKNLPVMPAEIETGV